MASELTADEMLRRLHRDLDGRTVWLGPGAPERLSGFDVPLTQVSSDASRADVAIVTVRNVAAGGTAAGVLPFPVDEVWGVAAVRCWGEADPDEKTVRLRRLIMPLALLELGSDGWVVREVPMGVSARDVQKDCPFRLHCGSELRPLVR